MTLNNLCSCHEPTGIILQTGWICLYHLRHGNHFMNSLRAQNWNSFGLNFDFNHPISSKCCTRCDSWVFVVTMWKIAAWSEHYFFAWEPQVFYKIWIKSSQIVSEMGLWTNMTMDRSLKHVYMNCRLHLYTYDVICFSSIENNLFLVLIMKYWPQYMPLLSLAH